MGVNLKIHCEGFGAKMLIFQMKLLKFKFVLKLKKEIYGLANAAC